MMLHPFIRLGALVALLAPATAAQVCEPLGIPVGQPNLRRPAATVFPVCEGFVHPLPAGGNPNFAIRPYAPAPIPAGSPTFLVITGQAPPVQLGPPLCGAYGLPGLIPDPLHTFLIVVPAGIAGPMPGPAVSIPIPPGMPQGMWFAVQTGALVQTTQSSCVALTDGIGVAGDFTPHYTDLCEGGSGTTDRCTYQINSIEPGGSCPTGFKVGNRICVECPSGGRCPRLTARFRIRVNGVVVCKGTWTRSTSRCGRHPCDTDVYKLCK